jgi:hypothetical protein
MSLTLLYQTHSPFARKALVFAHEAGLADRIEVVHHETSPTARNAVVFEENPLGKVPVLLREGLGPIFDSDVICAYLDTLHAGPSLIPAAGEARWRALQMQAVAQGSPRRGSRCAGRRCGGRRGCGIRRCRRGMGSSCRPATTGWRRRWSPGRGRARPCTWAISGWRRRWIGWSFATCRRFGQGGRG